MSRVGGDWREGKNTQFAKKKHFDSNPRQGKKCWRGLLRTKSRLLQYLKHACAPEQKVVRKQTPLGKVVLRTRPSIPRRNIAGQGVVFVP